MRHVLWNVAVFNVYCLLGIAHAWIFGEWPSHPTAIYALGYIAFSGILWSSLPVTLFLNWYLLRTPNKKRRLVFGLAIGGVAFGLGCVLWVMIVLWFHMDILGRTL
jgi:hypothetical protein